MVLRHVDTCSGIGGFALGFQWAKLSRPILFCDTEDWCRRLLKKNFNMNDNQIANDVKELANDPERLVPDHDVFTSGYPCQPFSQSGRRKGQEDPRHIYPYLSRIVECKRPSWIVYENVYGHVSLGLDEVLDDMASQDYATTTLVIPTGESVGSPHKRERLFIIGRNVAYTKGNIEDGLSREASTKYDQRNSRLEFELSGDRLNEPRTLSKLADATSIRQQGSRASQQWSSKAKGREGQTDFIKPIGIDNQWSIEPDVGRVANGIPRRVDKLRGLGNAIVPRHAELIGLSILQTLNKERRKQNVK
jgi:DNA (cytosine-5)-methyltransferase 1